MTDAVEAIKVEAKTEDTKVKFKYDEHEYEYDQQVLSDDSDIMEAFEEGKMIVPVKLLLGDAQYALWKSRGANGKRSLEEVGKIAEKMFGVTPGE
jgi:hypothetical protein